MTESTLVEAHLPCDVCGSSDAVASYDDGHTFCFSCESVVINKDGTAAPKKSSSGVDLIPLSYLEFTTLKKRGLTEATCKRYRYGTTKRGGETVQVAPYFDPSGNLIGEKIRTADKKFTVAGTVSNTLFGIQLGRGKGKLCVVTEGEIDALSVSQAMNNRWPVFSLPNGAASARKVIAANLEVLESYDRVVLCFDSDEPGQKAVEDVVGLFSPGKVAVANLGGYKDANEMVIDGREDTLRSAIWEAKEYRPDGVVNLADLKERIEAPLTMGTQYPWAGLNDLLFGFRPQELITWTAGTGVGKTAIVSELVYHLIKSGVKVGIVYLEEGVERAGKRIVGMELGKPLHLPSTECTKPEFDQAFGATLGTGNLVAYDHFGSLDEETLTNRIRYMVKGMGCQVVVLDHISMVVSGANLDTDERRMLDHIMTGLRSMTQETGASFHVVSHLRRPQGSGSHEEGMAVSLSHLRGTQAIAQLSDAVIAAERDQQADDANERNTTTLRVLKNRYSGMTGVATRLVFNPDTGRLTETDKAPKGAEEMLHVDY